MKFIHDFFGNYEFESTGNDKDSMLYIGLVGGRLKTVAFGNRDAFRASLIASFLNYEDVYNMVKSAVLYVEQLRMEGINTWDEYNEHMNIKD